ncbi:MAG: hypothetical protein II875_00885 [Clostridia bacterium]|nr:hypothetical protein [Clostridia bacterium]
MFTVAFFSISSRTWVQMFAAVLQSVWLTIHRRLLFIVSVILAVIFAFAAERQTQARAYGKSDRQPQTDIVRCRSDSGTDCDTYAHTDRKTRCAAVSPVILFHKSSSPNRRFTDRSPLPVARKNLRIFQQKLLTSCMTVSSSPFVQNALTGSKTP